MGFSNLTQYVGFCLPKGVDELKYLRNMKIKLYKDLKVENRVSVHEFQDVIIENQIIKYEHIFTGTDYRRESGESVFSFKEEFGFKGINTKDGRLNIRIEYDHFIRPNHKMPQFFYAHLTNRQLRKLRKIFGRLWWQKSENVKWFLSFAISLIAIGISIYVVICGT